MKNHFISLHKRLITSIVLLCMGFIMGAHARPLPVPANLAQSQQLILVISNNWQAKTANLQRYQRDFTYQAWSPVGKPIPVVIGKTGMGWGINLVEEHPGQVKKSEGDSRTPIGVFTLGTAFGYAKQPTQGMLLQYMSLTDHTYCVDDKHSKYYNQIVKRTDSFNTDWHSAEPMRQVPGYRFGISVLYNQKPSVPSAGSCIFMHIWRGPDVATTGCVAMAEPNLTMLLTWLNPVKKPVLTTFPQTVYQQLPKTWHLPT